ncbi:Vms1/Ankzf1 family peptidyl-tRNA hydrolase [Candidatus Hydrogenedentota bacterium]
MSKHSILPATQKALARLSKIQGNDRCVLTVYFPDALLHGEKARDKLAELPAGLLPVKGLTADELEHYRRSLKLWGATIRKTDFPKAVAWLGVVSWLTEEAFFVQLPATVEPEACLDNSAFLFPAARLIDDLEAYAVVYADHARASIYLAALEALEEEGKLRGDIKNHVRKGGWSQQRYERRRDKEIHNYCKAILAKLKEFVEAEKLHRIILAGDHILLSELEKRMSPDIAEKVVCRLPMKDKLEPHEIYKSTLPAAAEEEKREELWLKNSIIGEHAAGGRAVTGAADTLAALEEKRVRRLLIGSLDNVEFWRCASCGESGLGQQPACPECAGKTYSQDAANEFTDLAFEARSRVEFAGSDSLAEMGGVGALLRW